MDLGTRVYQQLRKGDLEAFREVFHAYSDRVYAVAFRIHKNKEQAEEVVQEVFLKLWQNRADIDDHRSLWPLLFVIAKRICFNQLRSMRYDTQAQKEWFYRMEAATDEHQHSLREMERLLRDSVFHLPPRQRQVWIMSREEGKSHKQIAQELGISPNTVKNNLVQTLKTLKTVFRNADYLYFILFFFFL